MGKYYEMAISQMRKQRMNQLRNHIIAVSSDDSHENKEGEIQETLDQMLIIYSNIVKDIYKNNNIDSKEKPIREYIITLIAARRRELEEQKNLDFVLDMLYHRAIENSELIEEYLNGNKTLKQELIKRGILKGN